MKGTRKRQRSKQQLNGTGSCEVWLLQFPEAAGNQFLNKAGPVSQKGELFLSS